MRPIIINSQNVVDGTNNSRYRYTFPKTIKFEEHDVALAVLNIYYSWFNITSSLSNNVFQYVWYDNAGSITYTITIPDGYYSISDLNSYLQYEMYNNGTYLVDNFGDYVYYLEVVENSTYYGVELRSYPIPTALPTDYTNPASITFPATATTPQFIIPDTNIQDLLGHDAGTYPDPVQTTDYSLVSPNTPQVSPQQSIILSTTLVNNDYENPNTLLYTFSSAGVSFGSIIEVKPVELTWTPIQRGFYSQFDVQFLDQDFNPIVIKDSNLTIQLMVRERKELV